MRALIVHCEKRDYSGEGHRVFLGGTLIGCRPWDASCAEEIEAEVEQLLAGMLREKPGWSEEPREPS